MDLLGIPQELAERRAAMAARLSPMARHQNFPKQYARPLPREATKVEDPTPPLRAEIAALKKALEDERREVARLSALVADPAVKPRINPQAVRATFCEYMAVFGLKIGDEAWQLRHLDDAARSDAYVHPRMVCVWLVKRLCPELSFPKIGHMFGGRDHTTIMHAIQRAPEVMVKRPDLRNVALAVLQAYRGALPASLSAELSP